MYFRLAFRVDSKSHLSLQISSAKSCHEVLADTVLLRYLLRAELIALHAASNYPGAQLYMECAQINVTGGGTASPATVSFPGAYKATDPGIKFQLYWPKPTSYTIPGPRPFTCSAKIR